MKNVFLLLISVSILNSCNSKIDYTKENLLRDPDLKFILQNADYISGYHDYDNNIIECDLKLLSSNEFYFDTITENALANNWNIIHKEGTTLILYKIIDNIPVTLRFEVTNKFVSVKVE